jgi:N-acetylglutamate synthase-like GNAT family acetyltransferase
MMHSRTANNPDLPAIADLLALSGLPLDGVKEHLNEFVVGENGCTVVACAGLERYGRFGLVRSVAVDPDARGTGLGRRIVEAVIDKAREKGVEELVLLTTTAPGFFARHFAFEVTTRDAYDEVFAASPEWSLPRCSTAVVMRKLLRRT